MAELIIGTGKHRGKRLKLPANKEVVVGRDESCTLRLVTGDVSRKHCAIRVTDEGIWVRDLGSSNGTIVNGFRIVQETLLKPGDTLRIGPMVFQVPTEKQREKAAANATAAVSGEHREPAPEAPSADDIAAWLMEGESTEAETGSTTIITGSSLDSTSDTQHIAKEQVTDVEIPAAGERKEKKFKSLADEAADIIRRWQEMAADQD